MSKPRSLPNPTVEQQAILEALVASKTSLMITAYAGCAKTTTLEMLAQHLPPTIPALALAFNVKIKDELAKRFPPHVTVMTLNGLGHRAWSKAIGKRCEVAPRKQGAIISRIIKDRKLAISTDQWNDVRVLVSAAMNAGLVPAKFPHRGRIPDVDESWLALADSAWIEPWSGLIPLARATLTESVTQSFAGLISYDDQIYMSAVYGGVFPRFDLVMVDEAQDLSPLNHTQVARSAAGRLIVVGDPKQAIYGFRGADSESMSKLRSLRKEWMDLPLATTFRCPQIVVERQQQHAPGFRAWPTNVLGKLASWLRDESTKEPKPWSWADVEREAVPGHIAVLCRNSAPLFDLAFKLIRQGKGCSMLGRDIGKGLIDLSKKLLPLDDIPVTECAKLIVEWKESQRALAIANDNHEKADSIADRAACLQAVLDTGAIQTSGGLRAALEALFNREGDQIILSTIHRAKGLEWPNVLMLDPWRIPSKWAKQRAEAGDDSQLRQEYNLRYVGETRAQQVLLLATLKDFKS